MASASEPESRRARGSGHALLLCLLLGAETLAYALFRLPTDLGFDANAFGDRGDFLSIAYLVAHGSRPAIDFGYHWGLVPILLAQAWFALFGATVQANEAIMVICALMVAIGMARMAAALRLGNLGVALLVVALPFAFPTFTLTYALEASLLSNALAEQAAHRRSTALALVTVTCFVNPSMAYLYGLVLLLELLWESRRTDAPGGFSIDWRANFRTVMPAGIAGAMLILILCAVYGPLALAKTILPLAGMAAHRNQASGFFRGVGRDFWYQPQQGLPFYLFTVVGFWIAASLWLIVAGLRALGRLLSAPHADTRAADELVLTCAILHVTFVTVFFGSEVSWRYYCYILLMGVAASSIRDLLSARIAIAFVGMALLGNLSHFAQIGDQWRTTSPSLVTAGMWASPEEVQEWEQVQRAVGDNPTGNRALVVSAMGCAPLLSARFEPPFANHFTPGELMPDQLARLMRQIDLAQRIVVVISPGFGNMLVWWPDIQHALDGHERVWKGKSFAVYGPRRDHAGSARQRGYSRSMKPSRLRERPVWRSLRSALASICRIRSRVTANCLPTSSSV